MLIFLTLCVLFTVDQNVRGLGIKLEAMACSGGKNVSDSECLLSGWNPSSAICQQSNLSHVSLISYFFRGIYATYKVANNTLHF